MASLRSFFCLTCLFMGNIAQRDNFNLSSPINQDIDFLSADVGDCVTLQCFYESTMQTTLLSWYKQAMGQKPKLMSNFFLYGEESSFIGEFGNSTRFRVATENHQHHLIISDLRVSDSATYYCIGSNFFEYKFHNSTTVSVKGLGLNVPVLIRQPPSGTTQPEDSMMLNCSIYSGTCNKDHIVYWFRNSELPGLIYTIQGQNNQHKGNANACLYQLAMQNPNGSQTGTDYCAVTSCGHMVFGDGSKLKFEDDKVSKALVVFLCGASAFSSALVVSLAFSVCVMSGRHSCRCEDSAERHSPLSRPKDCPDTDGSALWEKMKRESTWTECVYFNVKESI